MIPVFKPYMDEKEANAVAEVLKSGWIGLGPKTEEFEKKFASYIGVKHAIAVNSCTDALRLAICSLDMPKGEIITSPITFVSTPHSILYNNHSPLFADIEEDTLNIDYFDITKKVNNKTEAIIPVHYGGNCCDMDRIMNFARLNKLKVIEDCAHACGAEYKGKKAGSIGDLGCFSFHAVKNLATGDGGMITTNDDNIEKKLKKLRWCGITKNTYERAEGKYKWDYDVEMLGYKSHMNDIIAAIGIVQLEKLEEANEKRRNIASIYNEAFKNIGWISPLKVGEYNKTSQHNYVIRVKKDREGLIRHLEQNEISAGVHYKPIYKHSYYKKKGFDDLGKDTPAAEAVWGSIVTLPLYPGLNSTEIEKIITAVSSYK